MRLAALSALRSLIDLISYREIYRSQETATYDWQRKIVDLILQGLKPQTHDRPDSIFIPSI